MGDGYAFPLGSNTYPYANDGEKLRRTNGAAWVADTTGKTRGGKRPGPGGEASIITGPERVRIQPYRAVVVDPSYGHYTVAIPSVVEKPLGARPATGTSRIDRVIAHTYDAGASNGADTTQVDTFIEVIRGDETATPSPKDISGLKGAVLSTHLLRVSPTGDIVITPIAPRTVSSGGTLPVYDQADRDSIGPYKGLRVFREDLGIEQVCTDSTTPPTWRDAAYVDPPPHFRGDLVGLGNININASLDIGFVKREDTDSAWADGAYTVKRDGIYRVACRVKYGNGGSGGSNFQALALWKNGSVSEYITGNVVNGGAYSGQQGTTELRCVVGDKLSVRLLQNAGVQDDTPAVASQLAIDWLRP